MAAGRERGPLTFAVCSDENFDFAAVLVSCFLWDRYGISTLEHAPDENATLHSFSDDRIADFNPSARREGGRNIKLRRDLPGEFKLFSLLHLFGHIVEFNSNNADAALAISTATIRSLTETEIAAAKDYERRASRYGVAVLSACGLDTLIPWLSDFWAADWRFLEDVYRGRTKDVPDRYVEVVSLLLARKAEYFLDSKGQNFLEPLELPSEIVDNISFVPQGFRIL